MLVRSTGVYDMKNKRSTVQRKVDRNADRKYFLIWKHVFSMQKVHLTVSIRPLRPVEVPKCAEALSSQLSKSKTYSAEKIAEKFAQKNICGSDRNTEQYPTWINLNTKHVHTQLLILIIIIRLVTSLPLNWIICYAVIESKFAPLWFVVCALFVPIANDTYDVT